MAKHRSSSYSSTAEKVLLQPWFLPQRIAFAIHAMVPRDFWNKMRNFFDDYGCMICGKESGYHSNGMCKSCHDKIRKKLVQSVKRRLKSEPKQRLDLVLFRQEKLAKKLLGRYFRRSRASSRRRRIDIPRQNNPVYEALGALPR
ncbi:MAG TPA: hypothetical protein VN822_05215 [Candidatus Acidoferrales bacterium]|nr:hypothetical protein [Candidatus Acidoferrales bacterium]